MDTLRSLAVSLGAAGALVLVLRLLKIEPRRSAAAVSITLALFYSFGHVYTVIPRTSIVGAFLGQADVLFAAWVAAWILLVWFVLRRLRAIRVWTLFFNLFAAALVGVSLSSILLALLTGRGAPQIDLPLPLAAEEAPSDTRPDIYYIILDGYPRQDILEEIYSYDNSAFIDFLQSRGFYVAAESTSNYGQTAVSLASSLNFSHLDFLSGVVEKESSNYQPLRSLIQNNRTRRFLEGQGYHIIAFESGYLLTELQDADTYITFGVPLNGFETLLLSNSAAVIWLDSSFAARYRNRITGSFARLEEVAAQPSPKFVFAHIMAMHAPFVFGPNGEEIDEAGYIVQHDMGLEGNREAQVELVCNQLTYINRLLMQTVDGILENSPGDPVIILQADHGSALFMDWRVMEGTCFHERMSIFNAYRFPGGRADRLYPTITPVNTMRVVFDTYFGTQLGLEPDTNHYSLWGSPYDLHDVTDQVDERCPAPPSP